MEHKQTLSGRIGLFGGTFDPIHHAHLIIAEEVRAALALPTMLFIPAGQPPHKPGRVITPVSHRLAMLELALASNPRFHISRVEIERTGPSYLVDTLRLLHATSSSTCKFYFVIGWDSLEELHTWYQPLEILAQLEGLVAVKRPGYIDTASYKTVLEERLPGISQRLLTVDAPQLSISSSDLRLRIAEKRPIKYQLPEAVEQYIIEHHLYS